MQKKLELITFKATDGYELDGALVYGEHDTLIIHIHGMGGNFYGGKINKLFLNEISEKFDVLTINTRGHGVVSRIRGKKKRLMSGTSHEKFKDTLKDIEGAIRFAKKLGYKKIILSGHSTGCQKITYFQSKKQKRIVKGIILLSPCDDYGLKKKEKHYKKYFSLAKRMIKSGKANEILKIPKNTFSAKRWLSIADPTKTEAKIFNYEGNLNYFRKVKEPIFVSFGTKDYFGKGYNAKKTLKVLKEKTGSRILEAVIINGADHMYKGKEDELKEKIEEFLEFF